MFIHVENINSFCGFVLFCFVSKTYVNEIYLLKSQASVLQQSLIYLQKQSVLSNFVRACETRDITK